MKGITKSFVIENTPLENYSMNLVHFFLERHNYAIFNFEEKILENFNHPYYNIVIVYSTPLHNDVNLDVLLEKLAIIKKNLLSKFLVLRPSILIVATNCTLKTEFFELPKYVDLVNVTESELISNNEIFTEVYSDIIDYPLNLPFDILTYKINLLNIEYAKKISRVFNKKQIFGNIILIGLLISAFLINLLYPDIKQYFILSRENIINHYYFTLVSTNLYETGIISLTISIFLLLTLGIRIEKIFGTIRYLLIIVLSLILANTTVFAFSYYEIPIGFTPIIYSLISAFIYVFILFRRFLAFTIKRIFGFVIFFFILFLVVLDYTIIYSMIGALIGGFISSFIIGVPEADNGHKIHRVIAVLFYLTFVLLNITFGLK